MILINLILINLPGIIPEPLQPVFGNLSIINQPYNSHELEIRYRDLLTDSLGLTCPITEPNLTDAYTLYLASYDYLFAQEDYVPHIDNIIHDIFNQYKKQDTTDELIKAYRQTIRELREQVKHIRSETNYAKRYTFNFGQANFTRDMIYYLNILRNLTKSINDPLLCLLHRTYQNYVDFRYRVPRDCLAPRTSLLTRLKEFIFGVSYRFMPVTRVRYDVAIQSLHQILDRYNLMIPILYRDPGNYSAVIFEKNHVRLRYCNVTCVDYDSAYLHYDSFRPSCLFVVLHALQAIGNHLQFSYSYFDELKYSLYYRATLSCDPNGIGSYFHSTLPKHMLHFLVIRKSSPCRVLRRYSYSVLAFLKCHKSFSYGDLILQFWRPLHHHVTYCHITTYRFMFPLAMDQWSSCVHNALAHEASIHYSRTADNVMRQMLRRFRSRYGLAGVGPINELMREFGAHYKLVDLPTGLDYDKRLGKKTFIYLEKIFNHPDYTYKIIGSHVYPYYQGNPIQLLSRNDDDCAYAFLYHIICRNINRPVNIDDYTYFLQVFRQALSGHHNGIPLGAVSYVIYDQQPSKWFSWWYLLLIPLFYFSIYFLRIFVFLFIRSSSQANTMTTITWKKGAWWWMFLPCFEFSSVTDEAQFDIVETPANPRQIIPDEVISQTDNYRSEDSDDETDDTPPPKRSTPDGPRPVNRKQPADEPRADPPKFSFTPSESSGNKYGKPFKPSHLDSRQSRISTTPASTECKFDPQKFAGFGQNINVNENEQLCQDIKSLDTKMNIVADDSYSEGSIVPPPKKSHTSRPVMVTKPSGMSWDAADALFTDVARIVTKAEVILPSKSREIYNALMSTNQPINKSALAIPYVIGDGSNKHMIALIICKNTRTVHYYDNEFRSGDSSYQIAHSLSQHYNYSFMTHYYHDKTNTDECVRSTAWFILAFFKHRKMTNLDLHEYLTSTIRGKYDFPTDPRELSIFCREFLEHVCHVLDALPTDTTNHQELIPDTIDAPSPPEPKTNKKSTKRTNNKYFYTPTERFSRTPSNHVDEALPLTDPVLEKPRIETDFKKLQEAEKIKSDAPVFNQLGLRQINDIEYIKGSLFRSASLNLLDIDRPVSPSQYQEIIGFYGSEFECPNIDEEVSVPKEYEQYDVYKTLVPSPYFSSTINGRILYLDASHVLSTVPLCDSNYHPLAKCRKTYYEIEKKDYHLWGYYHFLGSVPPGYSLFIVGGDDKLPVAAYRSHIYKDTTGTNFDVLIAPESLGNVPFMARYQPVQCRRNFVNHITFHTNLRKIQCGTNTLVAKTYAMFSPNQVAHAFSTMDGVRASRVNCPDGQFLYFVCFDSLNVTSLPTTPFIRTVFYEKFQCYPIDNDFDIVVPDKLTHYEARRDPKQSQPPTHKRTNLLNSYIDGLSNVQCPIPDNYTLNGICYGRDLVIRDCKVMNWLDSTLVIPLYAENKLKYKIDDELLGPNHYYYNNQIYIDVDGDGSRMVPLPSLDASLYLALTTGIFRIGHVKPKNLRMVCQYPGYDWRKILIYSNVRGLEAQSVAIDSPQCIYDNSGCIVGTDYFAVRVPVVSPINPDRKAINYSGEGQYYYVGKKKKQFRSFDEEPYAFVRVNPKHCNINHVGTMKMDGQIYCVVSSLCQPCWYETDNVEYKVHLMMLQRAALINNINVIKVQTDRNESNWIADDPDVLQNYLSTYTNASYDGKTNIMSIKDSIRGKVHRIVYTSLVNPLASTAGKLPNKEYYFRRNGKNFVVEQHYADRYSPESSTTANFTYSIGVNWRNQVVCPTYWTPSGRAVYVWGCPDSIITRTVRINVDQVRQYAKSFSVGTYDLKTRYWDLVSKISQNTTSNTEMASQHAVAMAVVFYYYSKLPYTRIPGDFFALAAGNA